MKKNLKNPMVSIAATLASIPLIAWLGNSEPEVRGSPENPISLSESRPDSHRCVSQALLKMERDNPRKPAPEGIKRTLSSDFPEAKEVFWFACQVEPEDKEEAFTALVKCGADDYGSIGCVYPEGQKQIAPDRSVPYRNTDIEELMKIMSAEPK